METNALTPVKKVDLEINGVVTVPEGVDADRFTDEFLEWVESKGYSFGGGIGPYDENDLPY